MVGARVVAQTKSQINLLSMFLVWWGWGRGDSAIESANRPERER